MIKIIQKNLLIVFVVCFFSFGSLATIGVIEKPYVTCRLDGQLGNQLHQIATTLAYAWDNGARPVFPELEKTDFNIPINLKKVFFRLDTSGLPRPILHIFEHPFMFEKKDIPIKPDLKLCGYFQTWKYFDHYREKIIDIFAPHPDELNQIQSKYAGILKHPFTVGVHVRTFNKTRSEKLPFVGLAYYEKALRYFSKDALFVVFSDRINWCKHHFKKFNRPMIFIDGHDNYIEDFFLMSMLKHNIIGNSSFSWWAAYLNRNLNKIVIAPSHFTGQRNMEKMKITSANLPDWITIPSNPNHSIDPYPKDMYDYDAVSQSIDTQKEDLLT